MMENKSIYFNPCTKIVLLFLCVIISSLFTSIKYEVLFVFLLMLFGFLNQEKALSVKGFLLYITVYFITVATVGYAGDTLRSILMPFLGLVHKIYPVCFLSLMIIKTTKVGEFLSAMSYIGVPQRISIPMAVMLRYVPTIKDDWHYIKDSMKLRGISPSVIGYLRQPVLTTECIYVPMIMQASKASDELAIASVTRGIENPTKRSSIIDITFGIADAMVLLIEVCLLVAVLYMRYFS